MRIRTVNIILLCVFAALLLFHQFRSRAWFLTGYAKKAAIETNERMQEIASIPNTLANWPPQLGQRFPSVSLFDHEGKPFDFESLRGKPTLVEFVAMTCAACQAWSGSDRYGAFENFAGQEDLGSIEQSYQRFTPGLSLFDGSINFVQLIVYDTALKAPVPRQLAAWRRHFHFDEHGNVFVVSGGESLRNSESFVRVPGFMLLDKDLVIRYDALGHTPKHHLYWELLPAVKTLLNEHS